MLTGPGSGFGITGDYNQDQAVEVADCTVWSDNCGTTRSILNGPAGAAAGPDQYAQWAQNYGNRRSDSRAAYLRQVQNRPQEIPTTQPLCGCEAA